MSTMKYPVRGQVFTLREVMIDLPLDDSPCLQVEKNEKTWEVEYVQTAHLTPEEFISQPGWSETKWRFIRTTNEWTPIFTAVRETWSWSLVEFATNYGDRLLYPVGTVPEGCEKCE